MEQLTSNSPFNIMGYIGAEHDRTSNSSVNYHVCFPKATGPASAAAESIDEVEVIDMEQHHGT